MEAWRETGADWLVATVLLVVSDGLVAAVVMEDISMIPAFGTSALR
jgi:hypothetical protein